MTQRKQINQQFNHSSEILCRPVFNSSLERRGQHPRGNCRSTDDCLIWLRSLGKLPQHRHRSECRQINKMASQCFFFSWNCRPLKAELGFRSGDIIYVLGAMDQDGFYYVSGRTAPPDVFAFLYVLTLSSERFCLDSRVICADGEVWCRPTSCSLCRGTEGRRRPVFATNANLLKQWERFQKISANCFILLLFSTPRNC